MSNANFLLPSLIKSETVFTESLIKIKKDRLQFHDSTYDYYTLETKPFAVCILATTPEGNYLLLEEYRHPTGKVLLSCAGGYIDADEAPVEAAARELLEETGYQAESIEVLGSAFPYAGTSSQKTFYMKAYGAYLKSAPQWEESEVIKILIKTKQELEQLIRQGVELDANLCTALYLESLAYKS